MLTHKEIKSYQEFNNIKKTLVFLISMGCFYFLYINLIFSEFEGDGNYDTFRYILILFIPLLSYIPNFIVRHWFFRYRFISVLSIVFTYMIGTYITHILLSGLFKLDNSNLFVSLLLLYGIYSISTTFVSIILTIPFKFFEHNMFNTEKIYYDIHLNTIINEYGNKNGNNKTKISYKSNYNYEIMNETELQVHLKLSLKEERYEDANKIKELLKKYE